MAMKDEIKEILEKFNEEVGKVELVRNPFSSKDKKFKKILIYLEEEHCDIFKNVLDYITNLQEENERLNKIIDADNESYDVQETIINMQKSELLELENYKLRNEKAIEKLETLMPICIMPNNTLIHGTEKAKTIEETLNILNGGDEDGNN